MCPFEVYIHIVIVITKVSHTHSNMLAVLFPLMFTRNGGWHWHVALVTFIAVRRFTGGVTKAARYFKQSYTIDALAPTMSSAFCTVGTFESAGEAVELSGSVDGSNSESAVRSCTVSSKPMTGSASNFGTFGKAPPNLFQSNSTNIDMLPKTCEQTLSLQGSV